MLISIAEMEAAETQLQVIERMVSREPDTPFAGTIAALRAFCAYYHGDFPGCIKYTQQAIQILPQGTFFYVFSSTLLTNGYRLNGDTALALRLSQELSQYKKVDKRLPPAAMAIGNVVRLQMMRGNLTQAAQIFRQTLAEEQIQPDKAPSTWGGAFIGMGEMLCKWNDLEAAANHLRNSITLSQRAPAFVEFLVDGVVGLVRVLQAQQDIDGAFSLIQEIEQRIGQSAIFQWRLPRLAACRARLWLSPTSFNLAAAVKWAEASGLHANDDPLYVYEFEYLTLARVSIATDKLDDALTLLSNLERAAADAGRMGSVLECLILQALAQQAYGHTNKALTTIEQALSLAQPEGYVRLFVDEGKPMVNLLPLIMLQSYLLPLKQRNK